MAELTLAQIKKQLLEAEANAQHKVRGSCAGGYQYDCGYDDCERLWLPIVKQLVGMVDAKKKAYVDQ